MHHRVKWYDYNSAPTTKKAKGLIKVLSDYLGRSQPHILTPRQQVKQKLDQYLSDPQSDAEDSPLLWRKREAVRYPKVAKLACKYSCLCAASVSVERAFSCGGNIVSDKQTCLKPERVDNLALNMKK